VIGKVQAPLQDRTSGAVRESDGSDMGAMPLRPRRSGSAKAKSFHVSERGNPPQHVTSPSRIFIRRGTTKRSMMKGPPTGHQESSESSAEPSTTNGQSSTTYRSSRIIGIISRTINHKRSIINHLPDTKTSSQRPSPRAIRRASRRHGTANDPSNEPPQRYSQASSSRASRRYA